MTRLRSIIIAILIWVVASPLPSSAGQVDSRAFCADHNAASLSPCSFLLEVAVDGLIEAAATWSAPMTSEGVPATEGGAAKGKAAFAHGDYASAMQALSSLADAGDLASQTYIGLMDLFGLGRASPDPDEGARWLRPAANAGRPEAQAMVGLMYLLGAGLVPDNAAAQTLLSSAAASGYAPAETILGIMFADGLAGQPDLARALSLMRSAVLHGRSLRAEAQQRLRQFVERIEERNEAERLEEPLSCGNFGDKAVPQYSRRVDMAGFSIAPPDGENWCSSGPNISGTNVVFHKVLALGRRRSTLGFYEGSHTFYVEAGRADVKGPVPSDSAELLAFATRLAKDGNQHVQLSGKSMLDPDGRSAALDARFPVPQARVSIDDSLGIVCARTDTIGDELHNSRFEVGTVLSLETVRYVCLDPKGGSDLIELSYSERYVKGHRPGPSLMDTLKPEVERILASIRLDQP